MQNHVRILTDMKREKHKNLWEESDFYWGEISGGSLQFDRVDTEVRTPLIPKTLIIHAYEQQNGLRFWAYNV